MVFGLFGWLLGWLNGFWVEWLVWLEISSSGRLGGWFGLVGWSLLYLCGCSHKVL